MRRISAAAAPAARLEPLTVIRPSRGWRALDLRELWEYRELLAFMVWRDIKVVVFSLFFGRLAKVPSDGIPYPIFSFAALVPWTFFANGVSKATGSLVSNQNMLKKVYFPRLALPLSAVLGGIVDFGIAFAVLVGMMLFYGFAPGVEAGWTLPLLLLAFVTAMGAGLWFSALNVQYRDVGLAIGFVVQLWLFATPIAYPSTLLPEPWRTLYGVNPMAGVVEGFRWALLGVDTRPGPMLLVSTVAALLLLASGAYYFRRVERTFADVV